MKNINRLDVFHNGRIVGTLAYDGKTQTSFFAYDDSWLETGFSLSPFKLPLSKKTFQADAPHLFGLHGAFYDCLPDRFGSHLIDLYLHSRGVNPNEITPFTRLALLDSYSLGGLSFRPSLREEEALPEIDWDELHELYAMVNEQPVLNEEYISRCCRHGSSVGGSRPKSHWRREDGLWIVKFPGPSDPPHIGKLEYDYMLAAEECGLRVAPFELIPSKKGPGYFACKRFDRREDGTSIHRISLHGLLETNLDYPQLDYLTLLQVVSALCPRDLEQAYRLMCFNLFAGNFDDHAENFSFLYDEKEKGYRLSPAYDLTTMNGQYHQLGFGWKDFPSHGELVDLGGRVSMRPAFCEKIIQEVSSIVRKRLSRYYDFSQRPEGKLQWTSM